MRLKAKSVLAVDVQVAVVVDASKQRLAKLRTARLLSEL